MAEAFVDTDPETQRRHVDLVRAAPIERRLGLAFSLSATVIGLAKAAVTARLPDASPDDVAVACVERLYGAELADEVRTALAHRRR
jgi:hypothetical protein